MAYDIDRIRAHFPALRHGVAHFDGPGGSQVPDVVADAVRDAMLAPMANRGRVTAAERHSDDLVSACRLALADLLNADPAGILFGRSMTQLTYDVSRALARRWRPGDEVVVSRLDHDANVRPWVQAAEAVGATVRWAAFEPASGELDPAAVGALLTDRTRLVAVTGASNLIGTRPDLPAIVGLAHQAGALCYVDGVHLTAHAPVDVAALDADFFAFSPYKVLGPHCGVVAGKLAVLDPLRPDKLAPSTDQLPERFELGTLPYELMAGTIAAVEFIAGIEASAEGGARPRRDRVVASMTAVERYEEELCARLADGLRQLPGVRLWSNARHKAPTLLVTLDRHSAADAYRFLADRGVNAPAGSFYALEPSRQLGLGDQGGLRAGLAPYTSDEDCDRLLAGLAEFLRA